VAAIHLVERTGNPVTEPTPLAFEWRAGGVILMEYGADRIMAGQNHNLNVPMNSSSLTPESARLLGPPVVVVHDSVLP